MKIITAFITPIKQKGKKILKVFIKNEHFEKIILHEDNKAIKYILFYLVFS